MKLLDNAVIYCDNHLLVLLKPREIATQPDLEEAGKVWLKKKFSKPGNVFLHAVHRLDKPVAGLVLFARTSKALSRLQAMMRDKTISKTYVAEVEGILKDDKGILRHHLLHDDHRARVHGSGKEAILNYEVLQRTAMTTVVEIDLKTGRYHQIRAQFAAIGHPILGDVKYGGKKIREKGIILESVKLVFNHPVTQEKIEIISPSGKSYKLRLT